LSLLERSYSKEASKCRAIPKSAVAMRSPARDWPRLPHLRKHERNLLALASTWIKLAEDLERTLALIEESDDEEASVEAAE
jgi:hypothetical protein